jgi:hypothetical protein
MPSARASSFLKRTTSAQALTGVQEVGFSVLTSFRMFQMAFGAMAAGTDMDLKPQEDDDRSVTALR